MAISNTELFTTIKKAQKDNKVIYGIKNVIKCLSEQKARMVVVSANAQAEEQRKIERRKGEATVEKINIPNNELGTLCKQPFRVSFLAILKE